MPYGRAFTFFVFKEELTTVPVKLPSPGLTMAIVQAPGPDQFCRTNSCYWG
ncbi:MAG: hypothetical protein IJ340_12990 [Odoribacter sp.]|nr:hypothetical protein [Odoribacter sp.]